jgi:hypothetical protein
MMIVRDALSHMPFERASAIAQELARYGLGIALPHAHISSPGLTELPYGMVALEQGLRVSFVDKESLPETAVSVAWRWENDSIGVWAACCGEGEGDGDYS